MPAMAGRQHEDDQLVVLDAVAEEAGAALGVADGDQHLAELRRDDGAADQEAERQRQRGSEEQRAARGVALDVEAEDVLEIGEAVVAAEAHVVAEEGEQQRVGHRLGDDRQIDAGDAAAEGEPAEDERQQPGHEHAP